MTLINLAEIGGSKKTHLDGLVLLRYAHITRNRASGGTEQYLGRLNSELLRKHRITIIQMYLETESCTRAEEKLSVGRGQLIWAPVQIREFPRTPLGYMDRFKYLWQSSGPRKLWRGAARPRLAHCWGHCRHPSIVRSEVLVPVIERNKVNLIAFHWFNYDANLLARSAESLGIPFIIINHHANARLNKPELSFATARAAAVAGVSSIDVPTSLTGKFANVSDSIDTAFFSPEQVGRVEPIMPSAMILLPARIDPGKGHCDLLDIAALLRARKVDVEVAFCGAAESNALAEVLKLKAQELGLLEHIRFLGDLSPQELRNCYAKSRVVVLPSSSEGLPRVLLEAQAMERPVVAYNAGGTAGALINGETGFLVAINDKPAMAERIAWLLEDRALWERMAKAARSYVLENFQMEKWISNHERLYGKLYRTL